MHKLGPIVQGLEPSRRCGSDRRCRVHVVDSETHLRRVDTIRDVCRGLQKGRRRELDQLKVTRTRQKTRERLRTGA